MIKPRVLFLLLVSGPPLVALMLTGCESEGIHSYSAKRPVPPPTAQTDPQRTLGAIVPFDKVAWFIKASGRPDIVGLVEDDFNKLVDSLEFEDEKAAKLKWKAPESWEALKEKGFGDDRQATYKPKGAPGPKITIDRMEGEAVADVRGNVDRWRRLIGLPPSKPDDPDKPRTKEVKALKGKVVTLVDITGVGLGGPGKKMGGMPADHPPIGDGKIGLPPVGKTSRPFNVKVPAGWQEVKAGMFATAEWQIEKNSQRVRVPVTSLAAPKPAEMADWSLGNLNRWRTEVKLQPVQTGNVNTTGSSVRVGGHDGRQIDFDGGALYSRVVLVFRGRAVWFFKIIGPGSLVKEQLGAFDNFIRSLQFTGAADE